MKEKPFRDTQEYFQAFIRTAQYIPNLTTRQDILSETGRVLVRFFESDIVGFFERRKDGGIDGHHWILPEGVPKTALLTRETGKIIAGVLETGFLAAQQIGIPEPFAMVFLPITWENQTAAVMLVGHRTSDPIPKELLNVYLAVAGLVSNAITGADEEFKNIAARKRAEEALKETRAQLAFLVSNTPVVLYRCSASAEFRMTFISDNVRLQLGYEAHEFLDDPAFWPDHIHPDDKKPVSDLVSRLNENGTAISEYRFSAHDGTYRWLRDEVRAVRDENGIPAEYLGYWIDITDRKQAEEEIQKAQQEIMEHDKFLQRLIDTIPNPIFYKDKNGIYTGCNTAFEEYIGLSKDHLIGKSVYDISPKDLADIYYVNDRKLLDNSGTQSYESRVKYADGSIHDVIFNKATFTDLEGNVEGLVGVILDITERRKAEESLRESENKLNAVVRGSPIPQFVIDSSHRVIHWNDALEKYSGIRAEEVVGTNRHWRAFYSYERPCIADLVIDGTYKKLPELYEGKYAKSTLVEGAIEGTDFFPHMGPSGSWLYFTAASIRDINGRIIGAVETLEDITQRKSAEEALLLQNRIFETIAEGVYLIRASDGMIVFTNSKFDSMFGYEKGELIGKHVSVVNAPEKQMSPRNTAEEIMKALNKTGEWKGEIKNIKKDGTTFWCLAMVSTFEHPEFGSVWISAHTDITARRRVEEERERIRSWQAGVNRILESVLTPVPRDQKLKIITDGVVETFGADFCRIWLIEKGDLCNTDCMHAGVTEGPHVCRYRDKCLHLKASSGRYTHIDGTAHRRVPFGAYKIGRIASGEEEKFLTNDVEHDPRVHDHEWAKSLGLVSFSGYRLKPPDGNVLGVFALFARSPISPDMDAILEGLSRAVSLAIQKDNAEEALRESREMYRELIENINDVIFSMDLQGKFTYISPVIERLYGYHPDEVIGQHFTKFLHPDDHPQCIEAFKQRLKGEYGINNFRIRCKDGREENVCVSQRPMIKDGIVTGFNYIMSNITARKRAEDALKESEERFRTMIEQSPLSIEVMSPDGWTLQVNPAFVKLWGVTFEDLKDYNMLKDEQLSRLGIMPYIQRGFSGEAVAYPPVEYDGSRTLGHGEKRWVQGNIYPVRDASGTIRNVILVHEDITEQKKAEEALRESEKRYRDMFDLNSAVMLIINPDNGRILDANSSACRYYGYDRDEITGMVITDINIADPSFTRKNMSRADGENGAIFNFRHRKKNGEIRDVEVFSAPISLGGHRLLHSIIQDVTDRKRFEVALVESEQWFHDIFNNITDAILLHEIGPDGPPGRFTDVNDVACRMLGYTREELLTKTPLDVTTDYHNPSLEKIFEEQRTAGTARFETEYRTKDGTIIPVEVNTHVVTILGKKLMLGDARDITERKKAEDEERLTRERFETLVKVSDMRDASETELSGYVMEAACRLTGSTIAFIGTMTPDESVMDIISWSKSTMQDCRVAVSPIHFPVHRAGIWADAIRTHQPKIVNDYSAPHPGKKGLPEGHVRITRFLSLPILDNGKVVMVAAVANKPDEYDDADVTRLMLLMQGVWGNLQKRRSEEALRMSELKFRDIFNNTTDAIHIHEIRDDGTPGRFTDVNDVACRLLGYTKEEMLAKTPLDIATGYHNPPMEAVIEEQRTSGSARFETEHRTKEGTTIPVEVNTHVVTIQGRKVMLGVVRDITERKKAETLLRNFNEQLEQQVKAQTEEINASLKEKVLLLREIHHRVKNNLQIIISLVNLQMRQIDDERLKQVMRETQNRVRAMSLVHEKLYLSEDIARINLAEYTRFLATQLISYYEVDSRQVRLRVEIDRTIMLDVNTAIPLGLIINELVSNALKHAFPDRRPGLLIITVRGEGDLLFLTVKDNGIGMPAGLDFTENKTLGFRLVTSLVEQLNGTLELRPSGEGTEFGITIRKAG
ncbi:MAG: PAS domain S-box protein [Methanoregula sp.]